MSATGQKRRHPHWRHISVGPRAKRVPSLFSLSWIILSVQVINACRSNSSNLEYDLFILRFRKLPHPGRHSENVPGGKLKSFASSTLSPSAE